MSTQENMDRFLRSLNGVTKVFASMECYYEDPSLTKIELMALAAISEKKELIMRELAENLCVSMSTATVVIDKLVEKGLVNRQRNRSDRRVVEVILTAKGEKIAVSNQKQKTQLLKQILETLSLEEQEVFISILEKISAGVNNESKGD